MLTCTYNSDFPRKLYWDVLQGCMYISPSWYSRETTVCTWPMGRVKNVLNCQVPVWMMNVVRWQQCGNRLPSFLSVVLAMMCYDFYGVSCRRREQCNCGESCNCGGSCNCTNCSCCGTSTSWPGVQHFTRRSDDVPGVTSPSSTLLRYSREYISQDHMGVGVHGGV